MEDDLKRRISQHCEAIGVYLILKEEAKAQKCQTKGKIKLLAYFRQMSTLSLQSS